MSRIRRSLSAARRRVVRIWHHLRSTRVVFDLPRGWRIGHDLRCAFPGYQPAVVVDVGANVGNFAAAMLREFSSARVLCVEPVRSTADQLERRFAGDGRVSVARLALGAGAGRGRMVLAGSADMHYLEPAAANPAPRDPFVPTEEAQVTTLDALCSEHAIDQVGYLKIDTEGGDLEVLKGAEALLDAQRVDLVEVEAGMNPHNRRHVPVEALKGWLEGRRYYLFGVYEQIPEWPSGAPHLRRANLVFASEALIRRHAKRDPFAVSG